LIVEGEESSVVGWDSMVVEYDSVDRAEGSAVEEGDSVA
jgi:hypothetical protein